MADLCLTVFDRGHNVFLTGPAGSGKTVLLKKMLESGRKRKKVVGMTATTGRAATHLPEGMTIHRYTGIGDGRFAPETLISNILSDPNPEVLQRVQSTDILIIDEVSMMSSFCLHLVDKVCRGVRKTDIAFGGMQLVLCGDMLQLPPVPNSSYGDPGHPITSSPLFNSSFPHRFILETIHRQQEDDLRKAVGQIGQGEIDQDTENLLKRLQRKLPPGKPPLRLFANNVDVEKTNSDHLLDLQDEVHAETSDANKRLKTAQYPCGICKKECITQCVACDKCEYWFHFKCLKITSRNQSLKKDKWFCKSCL